MKQKLDGKYIPEPNSGCWLWMGATDKDGYGGFWDGRKTRRAHRASWELANGEIPEGLCVLHSCDVRSCVNPAHLWLGTNQENTADRDAKGRQAKGPTHFSRTKPHRVVRGENHGRAKLTLKQVNEIRAITSRTRADVAKEYGVSQQLISYVMTGVGWKEGGEST